MNGFNKPTASFICIIPFSDNSTIKRPRIFFFCQPSSKC